MAIKTKGAEEGGHICAGEESKLVKCYLRAGRTSDIMIFASLSLVRGSLVHLEMGPAVLRRVLHLCFFPFFSPPPPHLNLKIY